MKDVDKITLIFENCEEMKIPKHVIGHFLIDGLHESVSRIASNSISMMKQADTFAMEIMKKSDSIPYYPFERKDKTDKMTMIGRISEYSNISAVELEYEDGTSDYIYVDYDEGDCMGVLGAPNVNQTSRISANGHLYVVVSSEESVDDLFSRDVVDSPDYEGHDEEETHEFTPEDLPDMYRYVFISSGRENDPGYRDALAVRIYDGKNGWRFEYPDDSAEEIGSPDRWQYPSRLVEKYLREKYIGTRFSLEMLIAGQMDELGVVEGAGKNNPDRKEAFDAARRMIAFLANNPIGRDTEGVEAGKESGSEGLREAGGDGDIHKTSSTHPELRNIFSELPGRLQGISKSAETVIADGIGKLNAIRHNPSVTRTVESMTEMAAGTVESVSVLAADTVRKIRQTGFRHKDTPAENKENGSDESPSPHDGKQDNPESSAQWEITRRIREQGDNGGKK